MRKYKKKKAVRTRVWRGGKVATKGMRLGMRTKAAKAYGNAAITRFPTL